MQETKKLYRSSSDRVIGGVCAGLGNYFDIDPIVFRLIFILLAVFGGSGVIVYIIMWILIPEQGEKRSNDMEENIKTGAGKMAKELKTASTTNNFRLVGGLIILLVGVIFLTQEFFPFFSVGFDKLWPLVIIAIGVVVLSKSSGEKVEEKNEKKEKK